MQRTAAYLLFVLLCFASAPQQASAVSLGAVNSLPPRATATAQITTIHTVRAGESLSQIAEDYGVTIDEIVAANGLQDQDMIRIGQQLRLPGSALRTSGASAPNKLPEPDQLACPENTKTYVLDLAAEPIRLAVQDDHIYMIAGGDLFLLPLADLDQSVVVSPENLTPPDRKIGDYFIRELVYVAQDDTTNDLLLLDKTNDVYRFTQDGEWQMASPASPVPGQYPDPQFLAIQSIDGEIYALDADLQHIWQLSETTPRHFLPSETLGGGIDMAIRATNSGPRFLVLGQEGSVSEHAPRLPARTVDEGFFLSEHWPSQVLIRGNLLYSVDGEARRLRRLDLQNGTDQEDLAFRLPNMGRLRSIDVIGETLFALAGTNLYVVNLAESDDLECPDLPVDNAYTFYGVDLIEAMDGVQPPFDGVILPIRPRSYPGARRLYRYGVHRGLDIYGLEAPGLGIGSPIQAIADGIVIRTDNDYAEMTASEFEDALDRARAEHRTPPDLMERFHGRQVRIDHGQDIQSWYSHLGSAAPGLSVGEPITQGMSVGTVGVSGTSSEAYGTNAGVHLHLEIWVNGHYLGHGLSLYETMRLWQALFSDRQSAVAPAQSSTEALPNGSVAAPRGY